MAVSGASSWLTYLMLRNHSRRGRHKRRLGVLHSGSPGRGTHLAGWLISNGKLADAPEPCIGLGNASTDPSVATISHASE